MLTGPELGAALAAAIKLKKVSKADVARAFGVKPPSVQDWIKYGRISKGRIGDVVEYFSDVVGPEHWGFSALPAPESALPRLINVPDEVAALLSQLNENELQYWVGLGEQIIRQRPGAITHKKPSAAAAKSAKRMSQ